MFKKILGINKLEKNFEVVGNSLNRSWEWIDHFNKANSMYEERLARIEKSNLHLMEVTRELITQLQRIDQEAEKEVIEEPVIPQSIPNRASMDLSDKDLYLIQLVHQYAALDSENAIDTNTIYDNLTYNITKRGLRKKLNTLVDEGLLKSVKKGNSRYWFLNNGTLAKIKKALRQAE